MGRHSFGRVTLLASVLQVAVVLLGLVFPAWEQADLYPILGTLLALLAGFLVARWLPSSGLAPALLGGVLAGGVSSLAGVLVAAVLGQAEPSPVVTVLIATLTGCVAGSVGGLFGALFRSPRVA
jgi:hypothetical protein